MVSQVRDTGWFKSSYSGAANETCVEVRLTDTAVRVRDTKNRTAGTLAITPATWTALVTGLKNA
ncbi:DUF397 domain-containing protein [Actinokineospora globicatena]|uniref:DUF397 domain-containing protein n=1 Tax=Actinokineospora globicatena TaxID=103729 RepID=UPI0020A25F2E|nr:DUF397 domain-containing protein [Actinokineospora globicatena]MCP2305681.1 protein of unknown function (DUF397) [Actinokineospora globicatena]GLW81551.1 DUF397 domain-containing protein [Actinokineospora globicatena]GLW87751.1 DUF397 domain-containing protein [Actinokineospora globicatena]